MSGLVKGRSSGAASRYGAERLPLFLHRGPPLRMAVDLARRLRTKRARLGQLVEGYRPARAAEQFFRGTFASSRRTSPRDLQRAPDRPPAGPILRHSHPYVRLGAEPERHPDHAPLSALRAVEDDARALDHLLTGDGPPASLAEQGLIWAEQAPRPSPRRPFLL